MATENSSYDPLRNPQVDFDRTDLSPRGILLFLIGLLLCGAFIELVVWGMFRFMAKSDVLFPQPQTNPMASSQPAPPQSTSRSIFQNAPAVSMGVFPEPRLQVNDAADMSKFLDSEQRAAEPAAAVQGLDRDDTYSDFAGDEADRGAGSCRCGRMRRRAMAHGRKRLIA